MAFKSSYVRLTISRVNIPKKCINVYVMFKGLTCFIVYLIYTVFNADMTRVNLVVISWVFVTQELQL